MFVLNLVTPEKKLVTGQELEEIVLPAYRGELNILPGHAPLMTTLEPGVLRYRLKGESSFTKLAVGWGYCQVSSEGVNVLAESAVKKDEITLDVVSKHLKQYESALTNETLDDEAWEKTNLEIARLKAEQDLLQ